MTPATPSPLTLPAGRSAFAAYRAEESRIARLPLAERQAATMQLNQARRAVVDAVLGAELQRAVAAPAPEDPASPALVWFWFNHFNVFWGKAGVGAALPSYLEDAIRPHVRGRFRNLLQAASTHPAMLVYLDNARNVAQRVNENHARELLELHTLGVDGGYGQKDVQQVARVLTGLGLPPVGASGDATPASYHFNPRQHDDGPKTVLGQPLPGEGFAQIEALFDRLAAHPATARHLVRRLGTCLLGDDPPPAALAAAEACYRETDGHLGDVTDTLLSHAAPGTPGGAAPTFKDPQRWVVEALHLLADGQPLVDTAPPLRWLTLLGQPLFGCTTPDGYSLHGADWISPGQLAQRVELARNMVYQMPRLVAGSLPPPQQVHSRPVRTLHARLGPASAAVLQRARNPGEQLALLLASPEFMHRQPGAAFS